MRASPTPTWAPHLPARLLLPIDLLVIASLLPQHAEVACRTALPLHNYNSWCGRGLFGGLRRLHRGSTNIAALTRLPERTRALHDDPGKAACARQRVGHDRLSGPALVGLGVAVWEALAVLLVVVSLAEVEIHLGLVLEGLLRMPLRAASTDVDSLLVLAPLCDEVGGCLVAHGETMHADTS